LSGVPSPSSVTSAPPAPPGPARSLPLKLTVVAALYFAQGMPYGLFTELLPTFLRFQGVALADITRILADLGLAWTLKFLWAPLVDQVGTRRGWIALAQVALAGSLVAIALLEPTSITPVVWFALAALTYLSATQDIAIDAYTIELLDEREYGAANGIRVAAYRVALIATGGLLVAAAGRTGWTAAFWIAAGVMLLLAGITMLLPSPDRDRPPAAAAGTSFLARTIWHPLKTMAVLPGFAAVLLFVMTFKMGDFALLALIRPFWVDAEYSPEPIGLIVGTVGMLATIGGAILGGALTTRWGIFRALWVLGAVQALSNLGYYAAAALGATWPVMVGASVVEQFTQGLGTAAFLAFLMALCDRRFAATQYALLTALFGLGRWLVMREAGAAAQALGYETYFLITFALAFPAFLLLPWVKRAMEARAVRA
jgi:PAT family beta-lactamase induction signal transducer AmpG